ncbi:acyltransferase family protein [Hydrocarboniclastica marina]|uniref:Acyltransferase 3 domain-containing protein n=1 Tax=Hydrocarboniclastica marina TaxID=2259620 RepID=A0A4P7XHZ5_9ALTE|nr:acyltransferase family protein [Hydrocarboniclastica marina]QCF26114.1 hypothetical protein soil367_09320 [Hydrocarboniclastica marina]
MASRGDMMRYYYIDFLRGALMTVGVVYHAALVVRAENPWAIKTLEQSEVYNAVAFALHSFRMHAFFLLSGFFAAMLINRMGTPAYLGKRLNRIAVPLLVAALTLQLPAMIHRDWDTAFWLGGAWVGHLWFLGNLLAYMAALAVSFPLFRRLCITLPYWLFAAAVAGLYMAASVLAWKIPTSPWGSFWILVDFDQLLPYAAFFAAGAYLFLKPTVLEALHDWRSNLGLLALGALIIGGLWESNSGYRYFGYGLWALSVTGLLMGIARRLISEDTWWVRFLGESSYTVYLFHMPLLILGGGFFLTLNPHVFFVGAVVVVTTVCWALHRWVISQSATLAYLYNGKPLPAGWGWKLGLGSKLPEAPEAAQATKLSRAQ